MNSLRERYFPYSSRAIASEDLFKIGDIILYEALRWKGV
jgi:hypothetical protein